MLDPEDCFENHMADTLGPAANCAIRPSSRWSSAKRPERIGELIALGARTSTRRRRAGPGARRRAQPSPHRPRPGRCHRQGSDAGRDRTGHALPNVDTWQRYLHARPAHPRRGLPRGAGLESPHGKTLVWAKQTILCSGGAGQIYRETTNPEVATGDGHALAYRAGAELRDMEFMQFHPTVLYIAGSSRNLITEAMRGEGARLVDRKGHRFMPDYDERAELAPRDIVSQAIVTQMEKTRHPNVYLDLVAPRSRAGAGSGFRASRRSAPSSASTSRATGFRCGPAAHYMIGGVTVDERRSHDAARPVGGRRSHQQRPARRQSAGLEQPAGGAGVRGPCRPAGPRAAAAMADDFRALPLANRPLVDGGELLDLTDIRNSLKSLMWRTAGVRRDGKRAGRGGRERSTTGAATC